MRIAITVPNITNNCFNKLHVTIHKRNCMMKQWVDTISYPWCTELTGCKNCKYMSTYLSNSDRECLGASHAVVNFTI